MKTRRGPIGRGFSRKTRNQTRPALERVEDRLLLTTFFVNNTGDNGTGSLRDAITLSNGSTTALPNRIDFSQLPAGLSTISLQTPLPQITTSVTIDGTSAPGFVPAAPAPVLTLDASKASTGAILNVAANNVVIRSLDLNNFNVAGVLLNSGNNDVVAGCYIGLDQTGTRAGTNIGTGVLINTSNATVGGANVADRNVITGVNQGVQFAVGTTTDTLTGNYIGTNAQGTAALGAANKGNGVELDSSNNLVSRNVISGYVYGIQVLNNANFNKISGNFIGTDYTGNAAIGNSFDGIYINNSTNTIIGTYPNFLGTGVLGAANVISANNRDGIQLSGNSSFTAIRSNLIGIGADKSTRLGNGFYGILFNGGGGFSTIGGASLDLTIPGEVAIEAAMGNIIAFNGSASPVTAPAGGILITGSQSVSDGILSNSIYSNFGRGIQLNGANRGVLPPTINSVTSGGGQTRVSGTLFEQGFFLGQTYRIQIFSTSTAGNGEGRTFLGDFDVTTDTTGNAAFNVTLPGQAPIGSYITATATENVSFVVNNSSEFSFPPAQVGQAIVADVAVTVLPAMGDPATPLVGQPYVFAVTVTNNPNNVPNNDDATGVILTDTLPANSILIPGGTTPGATLANGVLIYNIGNLANGASQTFLIAVKPTTITGKFTDSAVVTSADIDANLVNNTDSNTPTAGVQPDATLTTQITPSANPTPVGTPLTYVVTVANQGPSTANNSVVTITLDPSFTNIVVSPDQGTYSVAGNVITVNTGILPSGSGSTITITATPTGTGSFDTTASVTSSIINPATGTFTSPTTTSSVVVANAADLAVAIAGPGSVLTGQPLLYTVVVTNNGPSAATTPALADVLPAGLTFNPAGSSDSGGGSISLVDGVVVASLRPIPAGGTDTITIAVTPTISGRVSNTVTVGDPGVVGPVEIDTDPTNNSATTITLVSPADVAVAILNPADPLLIGTQSAYQLLVTNIGPADATNVVLTDNLGPGGAIASASIGSITTTAGGSVLIANLGTLASGASFTVTILVNPTASGQLIDTASVRADQIDPNSNNNTTSTTNLVNPADVAVTVSAAPASAIVGTPISFIATVTNNGPTTATNVRFTGSLPTGTTFVSARPSQGAVAPSGTSVAGDLGTLAPGASATVTIVVTPTAVATLTETSSVSSDSFDNNPANNTGSATVTATNQPGTIEIASPTSSVPENAGSVTLTLNRVNGTLGTVTVAFSTSASTALPGVNFTQTSGTATFVDGQSTATITIPVLDDGIVDGSKVFFVTLSGPTGGAAIDAKSVAAVTVTNTDRDLTPPVVTGFSAIPNGKSLNGFIVTFSKALDPARASDPSNFHVFLSGRDAGKGGDTPIALAAAVYNPANNTVTLIPTGVLPGNRFYHVILNGTVGTALEDLSGNILAGSNGPHSNYNVYYGRGTSLRYVDSSSNAVTITLTGPGTLEIFRGARGDATAVNLTGIVAHKTKLAGSVKKLVKSASGHTLIGTITGLGRFGDVRSSLTTPGFYVANPPVFTATGNVSASSVTLPAVKVGRATVRGPHRR